MARIVFGDEDLQSIAMKTTIAAHTGNIVQREITENEEVGFFQRVGNMWEFCQRVCKNGKL
ncbi:MAG: hypothetical protein Q9M91_03825 [Candidatus Dojkabacteria bacterium]|nr:hypothetical protein [Candidatus Dojkabacteria bacterium]